MWCVLPVLHEVVYVLGVLGVSIRRLGELIIYIIN